jgi:hypothetical protein
LDGKDYHSSEEIKKQSKEAIAQARSASKQLKKSLIEKIKDLPVVQKVSELGTAGSVAVSTAAVAQTGVAVDQTQVFVASVANDVVEQRIEAPGFIDFVVDFERLNNWGQIVMAEQLEAAQSFVESVEAKVEVSSPQSTSQPSSSTEGNTQESSSSSKGSSSDTPAETESEQSEAESEQGEKGTEESKSSTDEKSDKGQEEKEVEKESQSSEESTEENKGTQSDQQQTDNKVKENSPSSDSKTKINSSVKTPVIHDSIDAIDDVKPHSTVVISPVI